MLLSKWFSLVSLIALPPNEQTTAARWPREHLGVKFDTYIDWLLLCGAVSLLGCPAIALPCGVMAGSGGVPIGVSIAAAPGREAAAIAAAAAYEAAHPWGARVPTTPPAPAAPLAKFI